TGQCVYYCAVTAKSTTTYSIVFHMDQPTTLPDGSPLQGVVPANAFTFYQFRVNAGYERVQFSLTSRTGFASLYISNDDDVFPDWQDPSSYQVYVPWWRGAQQLVSIQ